MNTSNSAEMLVESFDSGTGVESLDAVRRFWQRASCGEDLYLDGHTRAGYEAQARTRYQLEPYILDFADFAAWRNKKVLEIGVGLGADHQRFAEAGADLYGIDLTARAIEHTRCRLAFFGLDSKLQAMDAESLLFPDNSFDLVYSWGVLHHTPDTPRAIREVYRVLKPGGQARIMIYHSYSFVGYMLWLRYALLRLRPWTPLSAIYSRYLESPGTKAYSPRQARELFQDFEAVDIRICLSHGDLLSSDAGQRHRGPVLAVAQALWPRFLIRTCFRRHGLFMLISCRKPETNA